MNRQLIRRLAVALIASFAFAQVSVALAACAMDRGEMGSMMASESGTADDGCCTPDSVRTPEAQVSNSCFAHCTADLQVTGFPLVLVQAPAAAPALLVPQLERGVPERAVLEAPPPPTRTSRILLHSFLI